MRPPHHLPGGRFDNPWPDAGQRSVLRLLGWLIVKRGLTRLMRAPDRGFVAERASFRSPRAATRELTVTWIGHATFLLQIGGVNVLTDPVWSDRASPLRWWGPRRSIDPPVSLDALPPIDVVLLSHNHYDHLDERTVRALARRDPDAHWLVPLRLGPFIRKRGVSRLDELDWWEQRTVGPLTIAATPAQHFSARGIGDRNRSLWCGYAIASAAHRVYFAGDTAYHPEFGRIAERYGPFDAALLPIGAYEPRWFMRFVHMNPEDALRAYDDLLAAAPADRPTAFAPMHWGTFRLTEEPMAEPPERLRKGWMERGLPDQQLWVMRHGETRRLDAAASG